jgi:hypothetical protein
MHTCERGCKAYWRLLAENKRLQKEYRCRPDCFLVKARKYLDERENAHEKNV